MNTTTWICDTCGGPIKSAADGWVEWVTRTEDGKGVGRDLRLVHHGKREGARLPRCQFVQSVESARDKSTISDTGLVDCLGPDGLMTLLFMLERGQLPQSEVVEMIKRLHVPNYEHARHHFKAAISEDVISRDPFRTYTQSELLRVIAYAQKRES